MSYDLRTYYEPRVVRHSDVSLSRCRVQPLVASLHYPVGSIANDDPHAATLLQAQVTLKGDEDGVTLGGQSSPHIVRRLN
jgi:hypothetical protein